MQYFMLTSCTVHISPYITHTHTKQKSKAKLMAAVTQLLPPSDNTGMPGTTQTLDQQRPHTA